MMCWPVNAIQTNEYFSDTRFVYLPFEAMRDLVGTESANGSKKCLARVQIYLEPSVNMQEAIEQIGLAWCRFAEEILNWSQEQIYSAQIFDSMNMLQLQLITREIRKQLAIMQLIVGLICLVVALLIFVILFMIVMHKKKDIGIIRAMGTTCRAVGAIFLAYGGAIGALGAGLGLVLGIWATRNINLIEALLAKLLGFKIWKSGSYLFSTIPNQVHWPSVGWILLVGVLTAMTGALLPAWRASRLPPVEALHYE